MRTSIRPLWAAALVLALVAAACGGGDSAPVDAGTDADAMPVDAAGPTRIGSACTSDTECPGPNAVCLRTTTSGNWPMWPGGYCSQSSCTFGAACSADSTCQPLPGFGPHCFDQCATDADCRTAEGYACETHPFAPQTFCVPRADAGP